MAATAPVLAQRGLGFRGHSDRQVQARTDLALDRGIERTSGTANVTSVDSDALAPAVIDSGQPWVSFSFCCKFAQLLLLMVVDEREGGEVLTLLQTIDEELVFLFGPRALCEDCVSQQTKE